MYCILYTLEKTEGEIKNEQSRDTVNTGNTRHRTKTNKTQHRTHKKLKGLGTKVPQKTEGESRCSRRVSNSCLI